MFLVYTGGMRERTVEDYLVSEVRKLDGRCVKLNPAGNVGIPDRLVILPTGLAVFTEVKRPKGGIISAQQGLWHEWLEERDHFVEVPWNKEQVDEFIERVGADMGYSKTR